ncbi:MAG: guanylate kinase [Bdellovibrionota bacterium]
MIFQRRLLTASAFALLALSGATAHAQSACTDIFVISQAQKVASARAIVISAPSGGGKTTLMKMLVDEFPELYDFSVSTTTRQPRTGEVNGKDYEFITVEEFKARISKGEFVEFAEVHGNFYGTSKTRIESIMASGRSPLLLVDVQGADVLRNKLNVPYQTIFVQPPNMKVLEQRLRGRNTDAEEVIQKRLKNAAGEMARAGEFDTVVINDKLDAAYGDLKARVLKPAFAHAPVAKFSWPAKDAPADFEKITSHVTKAMKKELRVTRINRDKDVEWIGLKNARIGFTYPYGDFLKAGNLRYSEKDQGRDALTEITGVTALVGMEQGLRFVFHPSVKAKLAASAQSIRANLATGDLSKAEQEFVR